MSAEQCVQRGRRLLNQARWRFKSFEQAFTSQQWNIAIREAQECLEQAVKAAVLLTGYDFVTGHQAEAAKQLEKLLESQTQLSTSGRPEVASRIQDNDNYYLVSQNGPSLIILKKVGGTYTQLGACSIPVPNMIIDLETNGSTLTAKADDQILISLTDTSLGYGFPDHWYFPVKVAFPCWDKLLTAAWTLGKLRASSFYEELQYTGKDAENAGQHLQSAFTLLREAFGVVS